ncbi:MAG TPA: hypothetical protein VML55_17810 [Planctomycetaceae bacterium]|nr:hypothetical protein [Planctomycetaceae bacterium]
MRVRTVRDGVGYRLYQVQKPRNRHLVDVRAVESLPPCERIADVLVLSPVELVASKVISCHSRQGKPKAFTDLRDLAVLLLRFPELKTASGPVRDRLETLAHDPAVFTTWNEIVAREIRLDEDEEEFLD